MTNRVWQLHFKDEKELIEFVGNMDIEKFCTYCIKKENNIYRYILGIHRRINNGTPLKESEINYLKLMAGELRKFENNT